MFDISNGRVTLIATPSGEVAAGDLSPGMKVSLARGGESPIKWVGRRRHVPDVSIIAVSPSAFGAGVPRRELRLSANHAVFAGGLMVPVGLLVNGRSIARLDPAPVDCLHIELDGHDVVLAEQTPVETYREALDRSIFVNAKIVAFRPRLREHSMETMFDPNWLQSLRQRLATAGDGDRAAG